MSKLKRKFGKRMKYNYKRTFFAMFLFIVLFCFGVGYSFLTTNLSIDGTSNVKSASWDIHFSNVVVSSGSVNASNQPAISNNTTVTFNTSLEEPGDYYEFTVDVVNAGTLNAKLDSISITPNLTDAQKEYFNYVVTYADDNLPILANDSLAAGATETIKVRFEYIVNGDTSLYPGEDIDFEFSVSMNYSQGLGNDIRNYVYTTSNNPVTIGQRIPNNVTVYNNYAAAESALGRTYFLRHNVRGDIVVASYLGADVDADIPIFYVRGGGATKTGNVWNHDSPLYSMNAATLNSLFGDQYCTESIQSYGREYYCSVPGGVSAYVSDAGDGYFEHDYIQCRIDSSGESVCSNLN